MAVFFIVAAIYLLVVAAMALLQTRLLFPGSGPDALMPAAAERLELRAPEGIILHGVRLPSQMAAPGGPVILGFGGNAANATVTALMLHHLYPGADVLAFHYRGYGGSGGRPGAAELVADAPLIYDLAARRFPGRPVVAVGFSIGSGIAASLAAQRRLAGLILVTPFDSLTSVVAGHYPWLPVRLLFHHRLDPAKALGGTRIPVAILAAGADQLVPKARTDGLRTAVPKLVYDRTIAGADHNSIYMHPAFDAAMRDALRAVEQPANVPAPH